MRKEIKNLLMVIVACLMALLTGLFIMAVIRILYSIVVALYVAAIIGLIGAGFYGYIVLVVKPETKK